MQSFKPGNIMILSLYLGSDRDLVSKVILGNADITGEQLDTTRSKNIEDSNKGNIDPETHTVPQRTNTTFSSTAPTPSPVPGTGKDDIHITDPFRQQSQHDYIIATFQENIKKEIRKGTYKIKIAPSDLVDFGGQRSFDMTHQLFIRYKGTFVLMFNGEFKLSAPLKEYNENETTECKLVSDFFNLMLFCSPDWKGHVNYCNHFVFVVCLSVLRCPSVNCIFKCNSFVSTNLIGYYST
jgi:hypothetical protein